MVKQCESKTVKPKRHLATDNSSTAAGNDDNYIDSDDELEMTVTMRASHLVKKGLYYVTDSEKFQPPRKRPKYVFVLFHLSFRKKLLC